VHLICGFAKRLAFVAAGPIVLSSAVYGLAAAPIEHTAPTISPEAALAELTRGNLRFVESRRINSTDTDHDDENRQSLAHEQHPLVAVLTCSDSRVCPEFMFDQRLGGIFDIRNAGNLVDEDVMASMEYAVHHLHVPLLLVLGHKRCGAIKAVHNADSNPLDGHLKAFQDHMAGLKEEIHRTHHDHSEQCLDRLALENARLQAKLLLKDSQPIREAVARGTTQLHYGLYDIETGKVDLHRLRPQGVR
jgi:carbonic anhydrase